MLSLNFIPSPSVTFIKSNHQCCIGASWRLKPNLLSRVHSHNNKHSLLYEEGSQASELTQVHGLSSASSLRPKSRIEGKITTLCPLGQSFSIPFWVYR
ncbi:hypothetical protein L6164_029640 [Bauhinia variegata]|uniref:Uncharacterized protein n=1 Tax=Bauhinia variegata TaxID=167791 RepID=A0ACB9L9D1_BAUVA|nr:hypothetical protein L6164_029640 [Bauhinia variegata]